MNTLLNSYFVKTHRLEISITIIAIVLFLIYFLGAPHVFTRFPIYRAFMQSMPFFGIIAISATSTMATPLPWETTFTKPLQK